MTFYVFEIKYQKVVKSLAKV